VLSLLVAVLPEAAVAPILVFIGLEITGQAFLASPPRHAPAVAVAFVPAAAAMVLIQAGPLLAAVGRSPAELAGDARASWEALLVLGNGFVLTAVLWSWALTAMIDGRQAVAAAVFAAASVAALVGLVHSPLPDGGLFWPWRLPSAVPARVAAAYGVAAALCLFAAGGRGRARG
jgi:AGZA family xanthine/uracil permease-like MFS transporter